MTTNGECGASLLLEILIHIFCAVFFKCIENVCDMYRPCRHEQNSTPASLCTKEVVNCTMENEYDLYAREVQTFFGWAIKEAIDNWKEKQNKLRINNDEREVCMSNEYKCLTLVKSMRCFHNDIIFDEEYIKECYPISITSQNRGWLCLVAKPFFALGSTLLHKIGNARTIKKLMTGD